MLRSEDWLNPAQGLNGLRRVTLSTTPGGRTRDAFSISFGRKTPTTRQIATLKVLTYGVPMRDASWYVERRSASRHHMATPARFPGGSGITRDLSATGLFFLTDTPFDVGKPVELSVTLHRADPERPIELTFRGRVVRVEGPRLTRTCETEFGVAIAADGVAFAGAVDRIRGAG